ncbi:MAG: S-methyl-5-thioribose-1-phosphate isomerase [Bacteriovoracaceae bacterium]
MMIAPIQWKEDTLYLLDQRLLPLEEKVIAVRNIEEAYQAIKEMVVRGAPCIGFTGILGLALWLKSHPQFIISEFEMAAQYLNSSRPTAVNLGFEIDRTVNLVKENYKNGFSTVYKKVVEFGLEQILLSEKRNHQMADFVIADLTKRYGQKKLTVMTHCNTGYLACGSLGTALGVISKLHSLGRIEHVYADETRPYMQGSRLTAYELGKEAIPHSVVVEGAASYIMSHHKIDAIFVGADRIVKNGDTANKVGTSTLSIVAKHFQVPFYVVAPTSSFDMKMKEGKEIEIELRDPKEILEYKEHRIAPQNSKALNPSFDVTDHQFITGIACEKGLSLYPFMDLEKIVTGLESL